MIGFPECQSRIKRLLNIITESKNNIILLDFAGIEKNNTDFFNKLMFFLSYSPFFNHENNLVLFNVIDRDVNYSLNNSTNFDLKTKGYNPKPIPCIHPDRLISWIGVNDSVIEKKLTEIWQTGYTTDIDTNKEHFNDNFIEIIEVSDTNGIKVQVIIDSLNEIEKKIIEYQSTRIRLETENNGIHFWQLFEDIEHNYNNISRCEKDGKYYLTASGKYQHEFLSFIEKLYVREYRRMIATYILFSYFHKKNFYDYEINKILTVTLSSQMLGKEVADIYEILSKQKINLIPLSNYYAFNTEEPFHDISKNDNILVVNDVISTGNLSKKINESLKDKAKISSIVSIIDIRGSREKEENEIDATIISVFEREIEHQENDSIKENDFIWINPILNTPTTMPYTKSMSEHIMFFPNEFCDFFSGKEQDSFFKVGYIKQNTVYHTYYFQTDKFFRSEVENGFPILNPIFKRLGENIKELRKQNRGDRNKVFLDFFGQNKITEFITIKTKTKVDIDMVKLLSQYELFDSEDLKLKIDFVVYPSMSSIGIIENELDFLLKEFRDEKSIEVYPIPRIMTPRGWRFTFPPKFFNHHTKNKTILLLDDGSCTGETILQMIDTICFLNVSEIVVLSIFARLEDYQRELLTRIKQVRVKDRQVDINIFFGTHFHLPVFKQNTIPTLFEYNQLLDIEKYFQNKGINHEFIGRYIAWRKHQLKFTSINSIEEPFYLKGVDKKLMYQLRDFLGNYDSYRLYKEQEPTGILETTKRKKVVKHLSISDILKSEQAKKALSAVLIHEPPLVETLNKIYPKAIGVIKKYLDDIEIDNKNSVFILHAIKYINLEYFVNQEFLTKFLKQTQLSIDEKQRKGLDCIDEELVIYNFIGYELTRILIVQEDEKVSYKIKMTAISTIRNIVMDLAMNNKQNVMYFNIFKDIHQNIIPQLSTQDGIKESKFLKAFNSIYDYYTNKALNVYCTPILGHGL